MQKILRPRLPRGILQFIARNAASRKTNATSASLHNAAQPRMLQACRSFAGLPADRYLSSQRALSRGRLRNDSKRENIAYENCMHTGGTFAKKTPISPLLIVQKRGLRVGVSGRSKTVKTAYLNDSLSASRCGNAECRYKLSLARGYRTR